MFCTECGRRVLPQAKFCSECGTATRRPPDARSAGAPSGAAPLARAVAKDAGSDKRSKTVLVLSLAAIAFVVIVVAIAISMSSGSGPTDVVPPVDRESVPILRRSVIAYCSEELGESVGSTGAEILDRDGTYHLGLYSDDGESVGTATASTVSGRMTCAGY